MPQPIQPPTRAVRGLLTEAGARIAELLRDVPPERHLRLLRDAYVTRFRGDVLEQEFIADEDAFLGALSPSEARTALINGIAMAATAHRRDVWSYLTPDLVALHTVVVRHDNGD